jgi:hypothetical protein
MLNIQRMHIINCVFLSCFYIILPGLFSLFLNIVFNFFQDVLSSTSQRLHALSAQLAIGRVIFQLPGSWGHASCPALPLPASPALPRQPDLAVERLPLPRPQVEQYGGCGSKGRVVRLPYHLLLDNRTEQRGINFLLEFSLKTDGAADLLDMLALFKF